MANFIKQSTYLRRVIRAMRAREGWKLTGASNGEEWKKDPTEREAIEMTQEADEGAIRFRHETHGRVTLAIVWQGPDATYEAGEEIVSDYSASTEEGMDAITAAIREVDAGRTDINGIKERLAEAYNREDWAEYRAGLLTLYAANGLVIDPSITDMEIEQKMAAVKRMRESVTKLTPEGGVAEMRERERKEEEA